MKFLILILFCGSIFAQVPPDTEIFLFKITSEGDSLKFEEGKNISQNQGYDNQPSFYSDDVLIYAKTRNDQTDIAGIELGNSREFWINKTPGGGEYSPQRIPETQDIAAVRLDTTGLQLLYRYNNKTGKSSVLIPGLKIGYYAFLDQKTLLAAVLNGSGMDLLIYNLEKNVHDTLVAGVGRSLHNIPNSSAMSYTVVNDQNNLDLYILDFNEEPKSYFLTTLPEGTQDYTWLDQNRILLGKGSEIFLYDVLGENKWKAIADFSKYNLDNITRLTVNEKGTLLALAAELVPE